MEEEIVGRRNTLKYLGLLVASAAGREFLAGWLPSAAGAEAHAQHHSDPVTSPAPDSAEPYLPKFFHAEEFQTVEALTELIIPTDSQPGAREARVAEYIDFVVFSAAEFMPKLQQDWTFGLTLLDQASQQKHTRPFRALAAPEQEQLLLEMSLAERDPKASHPGFEFYQLVKHMTVEGFYTSRIGLIDVLGYKGRDFLSEFPGCTHPEHQT